MKSEARGTAVEVDLTTGEERGVGYTVRPQLIPHPERGYPPFVRHLGLDVNCYASVTLDAPWGRVRTLGFWLQERQTD